MGVFGKQPVDLPDGLDGGSQRTSVVAVIKGVQKLSLIHILTKDETRRKKAMQVLNTMLSENAQNRVVSEGQDLLSYSQDVDIHLTEYMKDVKSVIEENHMYIRIASNDFFSVSKDVVSKMISGEYDAGQAYQSFASQLLEEEAVSEDIVLDSQKSYSNRFHSSGGNAAYSVMANTLRGMYGCLLYTSRCV